MKSRSNLSLDKMHLILPMLYALQQTGESRRENALWNRVFPMKNIAATKAILRQINADLALPWFVGFQEVLSNFGGRSHLVLSVLPAHGGQKQPVDFYRGKYVKIALPSNDSNSQLWGYVEEVQEVLDLDLDPANLEVELRGRVALATGSYSPSQGTGFICERYMVELVSECPPLQEKEAA